MPPNAFTVDIRIQIPPHELFWLSTECQFETIRKITNLRIYLRICSVTLLKKNS